MSFRRMLPFLLLNIVVSATVFFLLLSWWESRDVDGVTVSPTSQVALMETPGLVVVDLGTASPVAGDATNDDVEPAAVEDEEASGPTVHIVQAGETLGIIGQQYDVAIEDIAAANDIVNVNAISVGQELIIPIGGLPTETPEPTAAPTGTPAPTASSTPEEITEEIRVEIAEVVGAGDLTGEAVRITNAGSQPVPLQGWQLSDESGNEYTFVDVTLYGSSDAGAPSILIHTEAGQNGPSDLYWGQEVAVWEAGETVTLRDAEGALQASYVIP